VGLFLRDASLFTVSGVVLGLCGYAMASGYIRRVLYELRPWEPIAIIAVVLFVCLIAATAAAPAVYRAARIDPATALRAE
jgi:ABC-type antimicrobial peptide transport system permease subunit